MIVARMVRRALAAPRWLLALVAGLAAALAHPPFGLLPGLLGYPLLLWLIDTADEARPFRSAFWRGWLAGLAYFAVGTWWIAEAFLVDIVAHGWMAPFAVAAMAGGVALFWGAAALAYRLTGVSGLSRVLVFAGVFAAFEWGRGHVLTGFPWNLPGETWRAGSAMSQTASLVGAYGLTWITLATVGTAVLWRDGRSGRIAIGGAAVVLAGLFVWGSVRTFETTRPSPGPDVLRVRIVQADVKQAAKYDPAHFQRIVDAYTGLTARPYPGPPADIVIWPEGAIPAAVNDYLAPGTWTRRAIEQSLRPGQVLLVGAYRYEGTPADVRYFNTLAAVRRTAVGLEPAGVYDKHRLVPFGEFLPLEDLLTRLGVKALVNAPESFATGPEPRPMTVAGLPPFQPLICYESLFPGFTRRGALASGVAPDFIVNVSNDAWFGRTSGPLQHLNLASYRAIEEGVPILRSTPTGVSAVINALGQVDAGALRLGDTGVIDAALPQRRSDTLYRRYGDLAFVILLLVSGALILRIRVVRALKRRQNGVKGGQ
ncbi:MAG: apolipoprotein N-acyltransferase [Parvibaculum sp.]|uniref:apolipoprotein N-acyltransferase n=1 Tax=Parvibaculum sp. TaxID=2024848 RepID=UPI00272F9985|nr:apolipoprotein N-acyltransferase [Parvibaculum sp.]MDP2151377.1 apolipoprotein N-acyltransferase [Parvibaculum sp.]